MFMYVVARTISALMLHAKCSEMFYSGTNSFSTLAKSMLTAVFISPASLARGHSCTRARTYLDHIHAAVWLYWQVKWSLMVDTGAKNIVTISQNELFDTMGRRKKIIYHQTFKDRGALARLRNNRQQLCGQFQACGNEFQTQAWIVRKMENVTKHSHLKTIESRTAFQWVKRKKKTNTSVRWQRLCAV